MSEIKKPKLTQVEANLVERQKNLPFFDLDEPLNYFTHVVDYVEQTPLTNPRKKLENLAKAYFVGYEIERLDKAHKRAKRELRKQQKALEYRNNGLKTYRDWIDNVYKELSEMERKYKHMTKACDVYFEENQKLMSINAKLNEERKEKAKLIEQLLRDAQERDDWEEIEREKEEWRD